MIACRNRSLAVSVSVVVVLLAAVLVAFLIFSSGVSANHGWADCSQYLYGANEGNRGGGTTISRIDCHGHVGVFDSSFSGVSGLATDGTYLFASNDDAPGVYRFDAAGTKLALSPSFGNPNAIAIDPSSGKLLVADAATGLVRRLTVDSAGTVTNDETIAEDFGTFWTIQGIAATAGGDVLFADNIGSVYKITSSMT